MVEISEKALAQAVPLSVHFDLTYRCNADCIHCYVEKGGEGEIPRAEIRRLLDDLAQAGTLFLSFSGGEALLREDLLDLVAYARSLAFSVVVKTNGILLREIHAECFARFSVGRIDISLYSHRPEVHDAITRVPGSWERSLDAVRLLRRYGVRTRLTDILMRDNAEDYPGVQAIAAQFGCDFIADPTVTPTLNGDPFPASLRPNVDFLRRVFRDRNIVPDADRFCAAPTAVGEAVLNDYTCSAGVGSCYISPRGDVFPCAQFPLVCGNVRSQPFAEIWRSSEALTRIRAIRMRDLPVCGECVNVSVCTRCPGLAHMAGDLLGPSLLDCEKAFARTGLLPPPSVPFPPGEPSSSSPTA